MADTLREALLFFLDRSGGRATTQISQLAYTALMIAKHWASADAATIAAIRKLNSRVACDNRGMTEKNAGRLPPVRGSGEPATVAAAAGGAVRRTAPSW
jgi:hypothetical protein